MLNLKTYSCGICKTSPDQISHHKSHIETQKHKDKKELFELKLTNLSEVELENKYKTSNICDIVYEIENIIYKPLSSIKKLNSNIQDELYDTITKEMSTMIEQSNNISNKEALRDKIHEIHNFLRNNGAGYGMNALKVFNVLYGLKRIEEKGLNDMAGLNSYCKFSYLLELARNGEGEKLAEVILGDCLTCIAGSNIRDLLFYEIPQNIKGKVFCHLVKEIESITIIEKTCNVLLSGKIYEYFIGRDASAISELGAYFTDRHIIDYIFKKLNPLSNDDGSINSMIDMFGGSGGFTTGYINYLVGNDINKIIKWETEVNKIYHYDMNEDVVKSAGLEFLLLTEQFPNMRENISSRNSFTSEFSGDDNKPRKYKYVLTNPPYGGDKNSKSEIQLKREKIKDYIKTELSTNTDEGLRIKRQKQLKSIEALEKTEKKESDKSKVCVDSCSGRLQKFAYDNKLKSNDKEGCSLMLLMDIVEVGGTVIGVLKEGVFFNKTYKDLRKHLIENFNVREVISVPSDQFENTSTKTSIIIFDNDENGKTTCDVKFSDLVIERFEEDKFLEIGGELCIVENKGDIVRVVDALVSNASRSELIGNAICSLNGKDYNKKEIVVGEGYELVKLGDICESQNGYAFKTTEYKNEGVPLITITHIKNEQILFNNNNYIEENDKYKKYELKIDDVIISLTGKKPTLCSIAINYTSEKKYLNQRCALLRNFKRINNKYFACIFNGFIIDYINKHIGNGSNQDNVSLIDILNVPFPIPKSQSKIQEWVDKISVPYDEKNAKQKQIKELEIFVQNGIKEIGENEECEEVELGSVCDFKDGYDFYRPEMDDRKQYIENENLPLIKGGEQINDYIKINKKYDNFMIFKNDILIVTKGSCGKIRMVDIDKGYYKHGVLKVINLKINKNYLYYYLISILDEKMIDKMSNKSVLSNMKKETILKMKLLIPKNKQLIQDLEPVFQQIEALQNDTKLAEQLYKQLIQELSNEAIPNSQQLTTQLQENDTEEPTQPEEIQTQCQENEIEPEQEPVLVPKKIKKTVKKTKSIIIEDKEHETLQETKSEHVQEQEPVSVPKKIKKTVKKIIKLVISEQHDNEQEQEHDKEQEI